MKVAAVQQSHHEMDFVFSLDAWNLTAFGRHKKGARDVMELVSSEIVKSKDC